MELSQAARPWVPSHDTFGRVFSMLDAKHFVTCFVRSVGGLCQGLEAWIARRANLFVEGMQVPHEGTRRAVGSAVLEVTNETKPCGLMDRAHEGLRAALIPEWRGVVCCRVKSAGTIRLGDTLTTSEGERP